MPQRLVIGELCNVHTGDEIRGGTFLGPVRKGWVQYPDGVLVQIPLSSISPTDYINLPFDDEYDHITGGMGAIPLGASDYEPYFDSGPNPYNKSVQAFEARRDLLIEEAMACD